MSVIWDEGVSYFIVCAGHLKTLRGQVQRPEPVQHEEVPQCRQLAGDPKLPCCPFLNALRPCCSSSGGREGMGLRSALWHAHRRTLTLDANECERQSSVFNFLCKISGLMESRQNDISTYFYFSWFDFCDMTFVLKKKIYIYISSVDSFKIVVLFFFLMSCFWHGVV